MKKIAFAAAIFLCLWQIPFAAANDRMDYLAIENRIQDQWVEYAYRYPQITRGESRITEQRLNSFLREYSQSTALNARLQAKKEDRHIEGETSFTVYSPPVLTVRREKKALSSFLRTVYSCGWRICSPPRIFLPSCWKPAAIGERKRAYLTPYPPYRIFI